jgi:putative MATE family efflux protein
MKSLWLASILNMVLAPCLIFGVGPFPRMGVTGAAVATTVSRGIGVLYQVVALVRGKRRLVIGVRHLAIRRETMADIVRLATPASMQVLVETASWLALVRILSEYGSVALAGYTIAMRVAMFALLPPWGLANAAATLVGQNLGAAEPERAKHTVSLIGRYNVVFLGGIGAIFVAAAGPIIGVFTSDPPTAEVAVVALRIVALGFAFFAYGMVAIQAFNGAGDTRTPMLVNVGAFWFFKLPLAWTLARLLGMGPPGVFVAIAAAYSLQAAVATWLFRRGKWAR